MSGDDGVTSISEFRDRSDHDQDSALVSSHGLSPQEERVLVFVAEKGVTWPGEVSRHLGLNSQDSSRVLAQLSDKGVLDRITPKKTDGMARRPDGSVTYNGHPGLLRRRAELFKKNIKGIETLRQRMLYAVSETLGMRKVMVRTEDGELRDPRTMEPVDEDEYEDIHGIEEDL